MEISRVKCDILSPRDRLDGLFQKQTAKSGMIQRLDIIVCQD